MTREIPPHFAATVTDEDGSARTYAIPADSPAVEDPKAIETLDLTRLLEAETEHEPGALIGEVRFGGERIGSVGVTISIDMTKYEDAVDDLDQARHRIAARRAKPVGEDAP